VPITNNRRILRLRYGLAEEPCDDCLVITCCAPCAVCQAARELKIRKDMPGEYFSLKTTAPISKPPFANEYILMKKVQTY
jgi:hypothetical protein